MESETKQCQNCKQDFTIEPDDFGFYEKMKVSIPTWCPDCRMVRRLVWRNERNLFRRKDALTGKDSFSGFPAFLIRVSGGFGSRNWLAPA